MTKRRWNLVHRHTRFLQGSRPERDMALDVVGDDVGFTAHSDGRAITRGDPEFESTVRTYREWLMANATLRGRGGKMRRALIRAEQKYNKLKRQHRGSSRSRRGYPAKWR